MDRPARIFFGLGLTLVIATALLNIGFIAIDDYEYTVALVVPAESHSLRSIVSGVDMRSPIPSLVLNSLARFSSVLGVVHPVRQYQFVLLLLGVFSFLSVFFSVFQIFSNDSLMRYRSTALGLVSLYFVAPLLYSRSMFEALAIPYLLLSLWQLDRYWNHGVRSHLVSALVLLMIASLFRFHVAVCGAAVLLLVALRKDGRSLLVVTFLSLVLFVLAGVPDLLLKGAWHASLFQYFHYNYHYSSTFGVSPFYTYGLLFLGLSFPPLLFSYGILRGSKEAYKKLVPVVAYFAFFVVAHSVVPHKEERFMIPVVPLFLCLLVPLLWVGWQIQWRRIILVALNVILLFLVCLNEPQKSAIDAVGYLDSHPEIQTIFSVEDTLVMYPKAFLTRPVTHWTVSTSEFGSRVGVTAGVGVLAREEHTQTLNLQAFKKVATFAPGVIENLLVKANPRRNARRGSIELWVPK